MVEMVRQFGIDGVWAVYFHNNGGSLEAKSIHSDPVRAIWAAEVGDRICFWPRDTPLDEAVRAWGLRNEDLRDK